MMVDMSKEKLNSLRCFIINRFGSGQHPMAEESTLKHFKKDYLIKVYTEALKEDSGLNDEARIMATYELKILEIE